MTLKETMDSMADRFLSFLIVMLIAMAIPLIVIFWGLIIWLGIEVVRLIA